MMDANWALVVLTFVLILVTGYYAWQNRRLVDEMRQQNAVARDALRVQLYDRRAAILGAVRKLVATAFATNDLPFEVVDQFARDVGAAPYLLEEADATLVDEVIKRSSVVSMRAATLRQTPEDDEMRDRQMKDFLWLESQQKELTGRFDRYLKLAAVDAPRRS